MKETGQMKKTLARILIIAMLSMSLSGMGSFASFADNFTFAQSIAGFPQDYQTYLFNLHETYPNWVFIPVDTGLDWNTAVAMELTKDTENNPRSMTENSGPDSWKSLKPGDYNWLTDS